MLWMMAITESAMTSWTEGMEGSVASYQIASQNWVDSLWMQPGAVISGAPWSVQCHRLNEYKIFISISSQASVSVYSTVDPGTVRSEPGSTWF